VDPTLRQLLDALGEPLVEVLVAPAGLDVPIDGVAIVDPEDDPADPDHHPAQLVLVIGARGRAAVAPVRAAARRGAAAVAVKTGRQEAEDLRAAAAETGVALLAVRPDVRWEHLELLVRDVVGDGGPLDDDDPGDLFSLAQTVALLTRGIVSIEDTASRVLAYSRSDDDTAQVDELRRLSILGWQGPPAYLRMLREWGVFDRLRTGEEVVPVDEHAELGIRRRLAVGIHAGHRWLGTIWVQEGAVPFAERAPHVLVGAARVAAGHLVRRRSRQAPGSRWSRDLAVGLLHGRVSPHLAAGAFGLDEHAPAVVAGFALARDVPGAGAGADRAVLGLAELADVVAVHAATYRRGALTVADGARVYAVLPAVPAPAGRRAGPGTGTDRAEPALRAMCEQVVLTTARRAEVRVQAGVGSSVAGLANLPTSRAEADRVLDTMGPDLDVAVIGDLRAEVLLHQTLGLLQDSPDLHDPAVARLVAYDAEHGTELVGSVVAFLDAMGDVRAAADRLTVHPNTLRYRVRRATVVGGLQLGDPRARLIHHLQLLIAIRTRGRTEPRDAVRPDESTRRRRA
jgi:DNA-binding PucR family transcriptional regulator